MYIRAYPVFVALLSEWHRFCRTTTVYSTLLYVTQCSNDTHTRGTSDQQSEPGAG